MTADERATLIDQTLDALWEVQDDKELCIKVLEAFAEKVTADLEERFDDDIRELLEREP